MDPSDLGGCAAVSAPCWHHELQDQYIYIGYAQIIGLALLFTKALQAQLCNSKTDPDAVRVCRDLTNLLMQELEKIRKHRAPKKYNPLIEVFLPQVDIEALTVWMDDVRRLTEATYHCAQVDLSVTCFTTPALVSVYYSDRSIKMLCPIKIVFEPVTEKDILPKSVADDLSRYEAIYRPFKRVAYIRACELLREYEERSHQLYPCCIQ